MKRDVSAYVHMRHDKTLPLYTPNRILDDPFHFPQLLTYLMNGLFLNQNIRTFEYLIHWNINFEKKILYEKINGSVRWNKGWEKQY